MYYWNVYNFISINFITLFPLSFSLFTRQRKRKWSKEKESTSLFTSSSLRSAEVFKFGLRPISLASQTQDYALQTVLGLYNFPPFIGGATCEQRAEVERARLMRAGQDGARVGASLSEPCVMSNYCL